MPRIQGVCSKKWVGQAGQTIYRLKVIVTAYTDDGCTLESVDVSVVARAVGRVISSWYVKELSEGAKIVGSSKEPSDKCRDGMECVEVKGFATFEQWYLWKPIGFIITEYHEEIRCRLCADGSFGEVT